MSFNIFSILMNILFPWKQKNQKPEELVLICLLTNPAYKIHQSWTWLAVLGFIRSGDHWDQFCWIFVSDLFGYSWCVLYFFWVISNWKYGNVIVEWLCWAKMAFSTKPCLIYNVHCCNSKKEMKANQVNGRHSDRSPVKRLAIFNLMEKWFPHEKTI